VDRTTAAASGRYGTRSGQRVSFILDWMSTMRHRGVMLAGRAGGLDPVGRSDD
jgi:hypothetical protein